MITISEEVEEAHINVDHLSNDSPLKDNVAKMVSLALDEQLILEQKKKSIFLLQFFLYFIDPTFTLFSSLRLEELVQMISNERLTIFSQFNNSISFILENN